jgi:hypothetical protein
VGGWDLNPCDECLALLREISDKIDHQIYKGDLKQQNKWLKDYLQKNEYICWGRVKEDEEFKRLFSHNTQFHRVMRRLCDLHGWLEKSSENDTYYYLPDFDIEPILKKAKWRNFKPDDEEFLEHLVRDVIEPAKHNRVNILNHLRSEYPSRSDNWRNEVIDNLRRYIVRRGYPMGDDKGDQFWWLGD